MELGIPVVTLDLEIPVISNLPENIEQNTDEGEAATNVSWAKPSATDNSGSLTLTSSHSPGDKFHVGGTMVIYTAVDSSGNEATESFIVTVQG